MLCHNINNTFVAFVVYKAKLKSQKGAIGLHSCKSLNRNGGILILLLQAIFCHMLFWLESMNKIQSCANTY